MARIPPESLAGHPAWRETLLEGAGRMGLLLDPKATEQFRDYGILLQKWGRCINLTSRLQPLEIVSLHFLDSLALLTVKNPEPGARVADLGSGAGFPGIPLKIARPDLRVTLFESHGRKASFLSAVIDRLGLREIRVERGRVPAEGGQAITHDLVVARAVAAFPALLSMASGLLQTGGVLATWKGPEEEQPHGPAPGWRFDGKHLVLVPGRPEPRALFIFTRA